MHKKREDPEPHSSPFYNNLVPAYQAIWPAVAKKRLQYALKTMGFPDEARVLEVGVGTGLSLSSYPSHIRLTGVDLSESMLAEAQQLIDDHDWQHVDVMPMNAEKLEFDDDSFDIVTAFHTISVVSDPRAMMSEVVRVCRPGGRVLMINHFRSSNPLVAPLVDATGIVTKRLGWRTDLRLDEILNDLPVRLDERYKPNPFSLFTIMKATCKPENPAGPRDRETVGLRPPASPILGTPGRSRRSGTPPARRRIGSPGS